MPSLLGDSFGFDELVPIGGYHWLDVIICLDGSSNFNWLAGLYLSGSALGVSCSLSMTKIVIELARSPAVRVPHIVMIIFNLQQLESKETLNRQRSLVQANITEVVLCSCGIDGSSCRGHRNNQS